MLLSERAAWPVVVSIIYFAANLVFGAANNIIGPTLPNLATNVNVTTTSISEVLLVSGSGALVGSFAGGYTVPRPTPQPQPQPQPILCSRSRHTVTCTVDIKDHAYRNLAEKSEVQPTYSPLLLGGPGQRPFSTVRCDACCGGDVCTLSYGEGAVGFGCNCLLPRDGLHRHTVCHKHFACVDPW